MANKRTSIGSILLLLLLWIAALSSAIGVVYSTFKVRQITIKLEALRKEANELQVVTGQFLLEQSSRAEYSRIESEARKKLRMINPDPSNTILVIKK